MHDQRWILSNILNYSDLQVSDFKKSWLENIENEKYLHLDNLFPFTISTLESFKEMGFSLYIITARQNRLTTLKQLLSMGLTDFFTDCFIASAPKTKAEEIRLQGIQLSTNDVIVGDTLEDVGTAKSLNIKSVSVLSGFYNMAALLDSNPDYIARDISQIQDYIISVNKHKN
jgi:phosphoglycolate phosphatase-like HAD superfamily hydrolase